MEEIVNLWNTYASKYGLAKVVTLTDKRKKRLKLCLEIVSDPDKWEMAIKEMVKDKFYLGENDRKWRANFDYFINTDTPFIKFLEKAQIEDGGREEKVPSRFNTKGGYQKLAEGVDNDTASSFIGDILKGIK